MTGEKDKGKSPRWMVTMLMLLMAGIGWGIVAGSYASDVEGWGRDSNKREGIVIVHPVIEFVSGATRFVWNAVIQIAFTCLIAGEHSKKGGAHAKAQRRKGRKQERNRTCGP